MTASIPPHATTTPLVPGSPLLGSLIPLRTDLLGAFERAQRAHGDVVRFRAGVPTLGREIYAVFHPDAAHAIMGSHWQNYRKDTRFYSEIRTLLGDGLLTSQDETWVRQKRFLQPLFTVKRVNGYATAMADESARLVAEWQRHDAGAPLSLHDETTRLTLRMVVRILFGEDAERVLPVVQSAFGVLSRAALTRAFTPIWTPVSWPTPQNRRIRRAQHELFAVCDEIIARRRAAGSGQDDFLGMLLAARDTEGGGADAALTDQEVREQVLVFLLAGHETTSTALTFALWLLGKHPEAQLRTRAEVAAVLADRAPAAADTRELAYTTMVLKEAMRLYPSAPAFGRRSTEASELCGRRVPAGVDIITAPWVIHRRPDLWESPARFDPERFTPEREKARHRYAWFPFGGGPRACIGQHFSMLESVIALACLVRAFHIESLDDTIPVEMNITLRPRVPVLVQARPAA